MPSDEAMLCNSGNSIPVNPLPARRRRGEPAVSSGVETSETPDVTSVVSLNGFLLPCKG
jgi:hypothetical protein